MTPLADLLGKFRPCGAAEHRCAGHDQLCITAQELKRPGHLGGGNQYRRRLPASEHLMQRGNHRIKRGQLSINSPQGTYSQHVHAADERASLGARRRTPSCWCRRFGQAIVGEQVPADAAGYFASPGSWLARPRYTVQLHQHDAVSGG